MKIDYTNLSFTQLIDKIEANRFFDLPRMVREAFRRLLSRVEALEDAPTPSESFIPLAGTEVGNPVTGDIEIGNGDIIFHKTIVSDDYKLSLNFGEGSLSMISKTISTGDETTFSVINGVISVTSDIIGFKGISSTQDYTPNITELDYVQKKYVDERGSVFNATTATLSESDLNTAYPNAKDGFSVIAPNVVGGGKLYIKAGAGWVYQQILAVV